MAKLEIGMGGSAEWTVDENMTASVCKSGSLPVLATPALVALMEAAACAALEGALPPGSTSVGVEINVSHTSPTPVGRNIQAEAILTAINGKGLTFEINAYDEKGMIGTATHKRAIVDIERFMGRVK